MDLKGLFEQALLDHLKKTSKPGFYNPEYHVRKNKDGFYVNPETEKAYFWWLKGVEIATDVLI